MKEALLRGIKNTVLIASLAAVTAGCSEAYVSLPESASAEQVTPQKSMLPIEKIITNTNALFTFKQKNVSYPNGDIFWIKRFENKTTSKSPTSFTFTIPGKNGVAKYVERKGNTNVWHATKLNGPLPLHTLYITTDKYSIILSVPETYKANGYNTIIDTQKSIPVSAVETATGYQITVKLPIEKSTIGEVWALESNSTLIDFNKSGLSQIWSGMDTDIDQKWSWDGFYVKTPSTYNPTGKSMYWRNPDNYLAKSILVTGGSRAADDFGWMMMHTILPNQNKKGYWETSPRSEWLWKDYNIPHGFYDTRFNTDIGFLLLKAYQKYKDDTFLAANQKYANYLLQHIDKNQYVFKNGNSAGILVADYAHEQAHKKTHSSLNHHLQEINYLYEMYLQTKDNKYKSYADKMLMGIKITKNMWVKKDNNLEYAYMNNGKMGLVDYPFLTYNDLFETQVLLKRIYGKEDPDLKYLMDKKRLWMDKNKITGYRK